MSLRKMRDDRFRWKTYECVLSGEAWFVSIHLNGKTRGVSRKLPTGRNSCLFKKKDAVRIAMQEAQKFNPPLKVHFEGTSHGDSNYIEILGGEDSFRRMLR